MWAARGGPTPLASVASLDQARQWLKARRLELAFGLHGTMSQLEKALYEEFLVQSTPDAVAAVLQSRVLVVRGE
jgi:hypothetical protein